MKKTLVKMYVVIFIIFCAALLWNTVHASETSRSQLLVNYNLRGGTYTGPQQLVMSSEYGGTIYYTVDNSEPNFNSNLYSTPITISSTTTIKARIYRYGIWGITKQVTIEIINSSYYRVFISPSGGYYSRPQYVTLTTDHGSDAVIRYTIDGSEPNESSTLYINPIYVDRTLIIKARSFRYGVCGMIEAASFIIEQSIQSPTISPNGGIYYQPKYVSIYSQSGDIIRYTCDGSEPNGYSSIYSGSIYVDRNMIIKAKAFRNGVYSQTAAAAFTVVNNISEITASHQDGVYYQPINVSLYTSDYSTIRYTTDNSEPSEWSSICYSSIYIDKPTIIKAKAYRNGVWSQTFIGSYVILNGNWDDGRVLSEARSLFDRGLYDQTILILTKILDRDKENEDVLLLLMECCIEKGDLDSAKDYLRRYKYIFECPWIINRYAEFCNSEEEYEEARQKIIKILPEYSGENYLYKTLAQSYKGLHIKGIRLFVYGREVDFSKYDNVRPVISEGRTLVPIRALVEALGARVDWDRHYKEAHIYLDNDNIELWDRQKVANVNGKKVRLDVPAFIYKERLLVPIRFVSEQFGRVVDWFGVDQTVNIISVYEEED